MFDSYIFLDTTYLYSMKAFKITILDYMYIPSYFPNLQDYLRSVTINFAMSGLVKQRTPRELIEGYNDTMIESLHEVPLYEGGDATAQAYYSLSNPPQRPANSSVAFFTGQNDYKMTRQYATWQNTTNIMLNGTYYTSISQTADHQYSPWGKEVPLGGTDGLQFSPDLKRSDSISTYISDLARNTQFDYSHTDDSYSHLDNFVFYMQESFLEGEQTNPNNANFDAKLTGTSNLTTVLNAYSFASKGHYMNLTSSASDSKPTITNSAGLPIEPSLVDDGSFLGVERMTGTCLQTFERLFLNMVIYGDNLFSKAPGDNGYFFPVVYNKRQSSWSQDQVDSAFGDLILWKKLKWVFFTLFLLFGLTSLTFSLYTWHRHHVLKKELRPSP